MSVLNFCENQFARIFDGNEEIKIATHSCDGGEIAHLRVKIFSMGVNPSGKIKLKIYPYGNSSAPMFSSNEISLSEIEPNFYGLIRFDFARNNLPAGNFDIYCEISEYSRNGDTSYLSLVYDFPNKVYQNSGTHFDQCPIAIEDFYYRWAF